MLERFFAVLAQTHNVSQACAAIGVSRTWMYKLKESDDYIATLWEEALGIFNDGLLAEALDRALHGWDEPVFYKGEQIGWRRRFSDRLMELALRGAFPEKYKDRAEVQQHHSGGAIVKIVHMDNDRDGEADCEG